MTDVGGWYGIVAAALTGGAGLGGIVYASMRKGRSDDGTNVTSAFATSQEQVKFWADKYGEISEKYGAVMAAQAAQAGEIKGLQKQATELLEQLSHMGGKLNDCEQEKSRLRDRALLAEDECSNWKAAFDSIVIMTQMAKENRMEDGLMNVAEERIRQVLANGDRVKQ